MTFIHSLHSRMILFTPQSHDFLQLLSNQHDCGLTTLGVASSTFYSNQHSWLLDWRRSCCSRCPRRAGLYFKRTRTHKRTFKESRSLGPDLQDLPASGWKSLVNQPALGWSHQCNNKICEHTYTTQLLLGTYIMYDPSRYRSIWNNDGLWFQLRSM